MVNSAVNVFFYTFHIVIHCDLQPLHLHIDNIQLISFMKYVHMNFFVRTNDFGSINIMTWVISRVHKTLLVKYYHYLQTSLSSFLSN